MIKVPEFKKAEFLLNLDEKTLFNLVQAYWTDLIDLTIDNPENPVDWYSPSTNTYYEAKCREYDENLLFIEQKKYNSIINHSNICYINSCPQGIFFWYLQEIEEPVWFDKYMKKSKIYSGKDEYVSKSVGYLDIKKGIQLDHLLIQYT
jgi:hypothetical protein